MNSRRETLVFVSILIVCVALGATLAPFVLGTEPNHRKGDPTDVTRMVSREALRSPGSLRRGASPARLTLVEFADYECPSCGRAEPLVRGLLAKRGDLCVVFRNFPLAMHQHALLAAHAGEVAHRMGKGWEMHDALYDHQLHWASAEDVRAALIELAGSVGLDPRRFAAALDASATGKVHDWIRADEQVADACSVSETPSFFLITPTHIWAAVGPIGFERLIADAKYWR